MNKLIKVNGVTFSAEPCTKYGTEEVLGYVYNYAPMEIINEVTKNKFDEVPQSARLVIIDKIKFKHDEEDYAAWRWAFDTEGCYHALAKLQTLEPADIMIYAFEQAPDWVKPQQLRKLNLLMSWYDEIPKQVSVKQDEMLIQWSNMIMGILPNGDSHT
jgi:hypothetical protein